MIKPSDFAKVLRVYDNDRVTRAILTPSSAEVHFRSQKDGQDCFFRVEDIVEPKDSVRIRSSRDPNGYIVPNIELEDEARAHR